MEKHSESRLSYLFAHLHLLSSDLVSSDSSHLCFSTVHIVGSFTSKLPSNRIFSINHPFWIPLFMETLVYLWVCGYFRNWIYYYGYPPFKGHGEAWNMLGSCFGRFLIGFLDRNSKVIFVANAKFHPWKKDPDCHTLRSGTSSDLCCQDVQQVVKWMASAFLHGR